MVAEVAQPGLMWPSSAHMWSSPIQWMVFPEANGARPIHGGPDSSGEHSASEFTHLIGSASQRQISGPLVDLVLRGGGGSTQILLRSLTGGQ